MPAVVVWLTIGVAPFVHAQQALTNAEYDELQSRVARVVVGGSICDVGLLAASPRRAESIVAVIDFSGRLFCNTVVRVSRLGPPRLLQELSGWWVASLSPGSLDVIQDVDGDGESELVVPTAISDYEGARACIATLPVVYRCGDERCIDISRQVPEFYQAWQRVLEDNLRRLDASGSETDRATIPCVTMALDKTVRMQGVAPAASLVLADEWATSSDLYLRRKAVWMLADIYVETGDRAVRRRLERLAQNGHGYEHVVTWLKRRQRERLR